MKQLMKFKIHSVVSSITNSSTELFMCDSSTEVESVKDILTGMLNEYNETANEELNFCDVFDDPFVLDNDNIADYNYWGVDDSSIGMVCVESAYDNSIPFDMMDNIESMLGAERYHLG